MANKKAKKPIEVEAPFVDEAEFTVPAEEQIEQPAPVVEEQPFEATVAPVEDNQLDAEVEKVMEIAKADAKAMKVEKKTKFLTLLNIKLKQQNAKLVALDEAIKEVLNSNDLSNKEKQEIILCGEEKLLTNGLELKSFECARERCLNKIHYFEAKIYEIEKDIKIADAPWDIEVKKMIKAK